MAKKVIIGAGPAGLYAAIKFFKSGVKDIVVYDPRANKYTRPGNLDGPVFQQAELGIGKTFWPGKKAGHIKDLERGLYKEAITLGIKIENKRFLRLHEDAVAPGVVVEDADGKEEVIVADYIFDCTGARREVIKAVNKMIPDSPLRLEKMVDLPVSNHFLAYVKMDSLDWSNFQTARAVIQNYPDMVPALSYARSIIKLRALGWNELTIPKCYGNNFGKGKVCLYLNAPPNLKPEQHDQWVQTVLECYVSPISYQHLPSFSRKDPSLFKPRFLPFSMGSQFMQEVSYKGYNLPVVTGLGDTQIDFDYTLGHGILDGMKRIDALFVHMEIIDGEIYYFDSKEYLTSMHELMSEHKKEVINAAHKQQKAFTDALESGQLRLRQAMMDSSDPAEQDAIAEILKEIKARQSYIQGSQRFEECHDKTKRLKIGTDISAVTAKLELIHSDLLKALNLPAIFAKEKTHTQELLEQLAASWKELGNTLYKQGKFPEAVNAYKKALDIYNVRELSQNNTNKMLPIYSNLALSYFGQALYSEAIAAGNMALSLSEKCEQHFPSLQEKIIFNLIKALCAQANQHLLDSQNHEARKLHSQVDELMVQHQANLSSNSQSQLTVIIQSLQLRLPPSKQASEKSEQPCDAVSVNEENNKDKRPDYSYARLLTTEGMFSTSTNSKPTEEKPANSKPTEEKPAKPCIIL